MSIIGERGAGAVRGATACKGTATHERNAGAAGGAATHEQATALWVGAFFDEMVRWGMRDVVVSPGSRSTALAMAVFELSCRRPDDLHLYVDVDERGAAFFALGMAKASGRPVACICTSGTALANYYPAVIEAATSRVPLVVLSGDRPPHLQGLGAPQTADQLKVYGDNVRVFRAMPLPGASERDLAFVRQAAREACLAALGGAASFGSCAPDAGAGTCANTTADADAVADADMAVETRADLEANVPRIDAQVASRACERMAGPVHVNFPFDEPLKPDFAGADVLAGDVFAADRRVSAVYATPAAEAFEDSVLLGGRTVLDDAGVRHVRRMLEGRRALILAGEGTCSTLGEAHEVVAWTRALALPILADPLSGLRSVDAPEVIDNYDNIARRDDCPVPEVVIRFGRYPVSKHATVMAAKAATSIVVDVAQTRDFNFTTDLFVASTPLDFVRNAWAGAVADAGAGANAEACVGMDADERQRNYLARWTALNDEERLRICAVRQGGAAFGAQLARTAPDAPDSRDTFEGAYVSAILELAPAESCVFAANSMAVRALDTFYVKDGKPLCVLCNRGQNGIDGTTSTALGVSRSFAQTTYLTGDFTLLHDLNALALRCELATHHAKPDRSVVIVLLNNDGGAIFDMLPQASDDAYFERLFLVPQDVRFEHAARAFGVTYRHAATVKQFRAMYEELLGVPGISLIEVSLPLRGVKERYHAYQQK